MDPSATHLPPIHVDRENFLTEHFVLPPLPAVVIRVLEGIRSGDASTSEVASLLGADASLVAQILKIVNSAYYGLPRRITEVRHAVAYLGLAEIERLALTATVMRSFAPRESAEFERFWFHSFYAALVSKRLCRKYGKGLEAEELHTAALLHDIGKLVYMKFFPDHFRALADHCQTHGAMMVDAERHFGLPSHLLFGSILCDRWRLPEQVRRACEQHELEHLVAEPDGPDEVRLICLANLLSNLAAENLAPEQKNAIRRATTVALNGDEQDFLLLMAEVYELRSEVDGFLRQL